MRARSSFSLVLVLALAAGGCASGGSGSGSDSSDAPRGNSTLIVAAELEAVANLSTYDAIQRLRPQWLRPRSGATPAIVVVDGAPMGNADALQAIPAGSVEEIRYRNGRDATTRYGTGAGGGAIEVRTKG